jgi:putative ABC transport system permease protein
LSYQLQPLADIFLHSNHITNDIFEHGNFDILFYISVAAYLLIGSVLINFILLSFAYYSNLLKGIGIRKVFGAPQKSVMTYFLFESILLSSIAGLIAISLIIFSSAIFDFGFLDFINLKVISYFLLVILLVGVIAGGYISVNLSALKPMLLLKSKIISSSKSSLIRRSLMVLQVLILCGLMCFSLLINRQIDFSLNSDLGLETDNLIVLKTQGKGVKNLGAFKDYLLNNSNIVSVAGGINLPPTESFAKTLIKAEDESFNQFEVFWSDHDIIETMGFQLLSGSSFKELKGSKNNNYIILNETAAKLLKLNTVSDDFIEYGGQKNKIQGIIKDFHMRSFDHPIEPMIISLNNNSDDLVIRIKEDAYQDVSQLINQNINRFVEGEYDISLFESTLKSMYSRLFYFYDIVKVFLFFTILITAMGMFALSQYDIRLKQKEIAIRKLLGSTIPETISFLSKPYLGIVGVAFILSIPIVSYLMDIWRSNFIYAYSNYILIFTIALIGAMIVLIFSVVYNLIKNSRINIVEMLKCE